MFAFASYNAGPGRVRQLRKEAEKRGLDYRLVVENRARGDEAKKAIAPDAK